MTTIDINNLEHKLSQLTFSNRFIPVAYDLSLNVDPSKPNYSGVVSLTIKQNKSYSGGDGGERFFSIVLDTAELISIKASLFLEENGEPLKLKAKLNKDLQQTAYSSEDLKFSDIQSDDNLILEINFMAVIRNILTYKTLTKGAFKTNYTNPITGKADLQVLSTHCQPHFAKYVFPCIDDISIKATIQLSLTVDNKFTCISNMPVESSSRVHESTLKIVKFEKSPLMTTSIFSFAIGDFEFLENKVNLTFSKKQLPIRIYTQVGDTKRADYALKIVSEGIQALESKFQLEYPLPKLDFVAVPFLSDGGVENWSMIQVITDHILTPDWVTTPSKLQELKKNIRDVLIHEIVHMYVGDYITFDSYDHTWLNESFATFMSNTIINEIFENKTWFKSLNTDLSNLKYSQRLPDSKPIYLQNVSTARIDETFTKGSYEKGIFVLRMLASLFNNPISNDNYDAFFKMIGEFIKANAFGIFKPIDLWNFLKNHNSNKFNYDIPTIMNSWIRTPGFPVLFVTKESEDKIKIEQHRCQYEENSDIEDVPFQIPLFIKLSDGSVLRQMVTDRFLIIENKDEFFFLNANESAILQIVYPLDTYEKISTKFDVLNPIEQNLFFKDLSSIIGTNYQSPSIILAFFKIFKNIKKVSKPDTTAMVLALTMLNNISKSILTKAYFSDSELYKKLNCFLNELTNKFISQLDWDDVRWSELSSEQLKLRESILSLKFDSSLAQTIGKKLYRKLMHGPKKSVPAELITTIFSIIATSATIKEYKDINRLIHNPGLIVNNSFNADNADVQTAAINSLGFMTDPELRHKTLNFVSTNLDIRMVELALLGFRFQMPAYGELWDWFKNHWLSWYSKYVREKSSSRSIFFKNVAALVLECGVYSPHLKVEVEKFVDEKKSQDLENWLEEALAKYDNVLALNDADDELKILLS